MSTPDYEQRLAELETNAWYRLAELEARVAKLEQREPEPPRPGHNIRGAHDSAAAELAHNARQRFHESKANWL